MTLDSPRLLIGAACILVVCTMWGRAMVESGSAYRAAEEALENGDHESAAIHFRHAAQWVAPAGTRSGAAIDRLVELGEDHEDRGEIASALFAYRSARSAIMATRWLVVPHRSELEGIHGGIARLMSVHASGEGQPDPVLEARYRAELDAFAERAPNRWMALGAGLAFLAWLGSLIWIVRRGWTDAGEIVISRLLGALASSVVLLALWLGLTRLA